MYLKGYTVISNTYFSFRESKKYIEKENLIHCRSFKIYLCAHAENIIQGDMHDVHTADAAATYDILTLLFFHIVPLHILFVRNVNPAAPCILHVYIYI